MDQPLNEAARLQTLREYRILDTGPDEAIDRITRLASLLCNTPISLVTLLDEHRQWFKSSVGMAESETPRQVAFCNHVVADGAPLEVPDATLDERFRQNPLVTTEPAIRFYAGYPLADPDGYVLGALCVIDQQPRQLSPRQHQALELLSQTVMDLIVERRNQQRQRQLDQLFVQAGDLIAVTNRSGYFKMVNPAFERVLGWRADELLRAELDTWVHPEDRASTHQVLESVTTDSMELTHRFRCQDGTYRHLHWVLSPEPGTDSLFAIIRDVTAQQQQEEALRQAQQQLRQANEELERQVAERTAVIQKLSALQRAIFTHAGLAITVTDPGGLIQLVNPALEKLTGYQSEELIGQLTAGQLRDPTQRQQLIDQLQETSDESQLTDAQLVIPHLAQHGVLQTETALRTKDGRSTPVISIFTGLYDEDQTLLGYVDLSLDMSSLKQAESARQLAFQRHQLATKAGKLGVWELNLRTGAIQLEADFYTLLGLPRPASITHLRDLERLLSPSDRTQFMPRIQALLGQDTALNTEFRVVSPVDGAIYYLRVEGQVLADDQGKPERIIGVMRDRTRARQIQRALQASEARYRLLVDELQVVVFQTDTRGHWQFLNPAWEAVTGYAVEITLGQLFLDALLPESRANSQGIFEGLIASQHPTTRHLTRVRHQGGGYRWVEMFAQPTLDAHGQLTGVTGTLTDVTDKKEAQDRARQLHERLQLATQAVGQGIWEQDLEQGHLYWDDRLCVAIGIQPGRADWSFEEFIRMMHPDDRALFLESVQQVTRVGSSEVRFFNVCRMIKPDGTIIYLETHGQVVKNQQGDPIRAIGVAWDVTPRKQAEAALQESEQRFREIAENVDEVFWIHAVEPFELLYINPAYERIFGVDAYRRPLGEVPFWETILAEDRAWVMAEFDHYRHGQEVTLQFRVQGTHPAIRWVQIRTFIMRDEAGVPVRYIGIGNDITSQKEEAMVLQQSLAREQDLNKLKSQFVATASHEFRTPLTTIQSSADLIKLYLDKPQETAKPLIEKHLGAIHQQIQTIDGLLTDLLSIGTIEAGKVAFHPHWVEVTALCQQVIASHFSHQSDGRMVRLSLEGVPGRTLLDTKLMGHVLVNLLSNAFKFSRKDPRLVIEFRTNEVVIQVIDTGIGIPASDVSSLFQTFFRARNTTAIQGTGLGLVIARQYVELQGGTLTVESEEGQGTTFTIVSPTIIRG